MALTVYKKDGWCVVRYNNQIKGYKVECSTEQEIYEETARECTFNCQTPKEVIDRLYHWINKVTYKDYLPMEILEDVNKLEDRETLFLESCSFKIHIECTK